MNIFAVVLMAAMFQEQGPAIDPPRSVEVQESAAPGEAVEFRIAGMQAADEVRWVLTEPGDAKVFINDGSCIVDAAPDYTGPVSLVAIVVNHEKREIVDLSASTVIVEPDIPNPDPSVSVGQKETVEPSGLAQASRRAAPLYDGRVLGAWRRAAQALQRLDDDGKLDMASYNKVIETLSDDLRKAAADAGWGKHWNAVFGQMEGRPVKESPEMFGQIADGIAAKK